MDYNFKYVPAEQLENIIKLVKSKKSEMRQAVIATNQTADSTPSQALNKISKTNSKSSIKINNEECKIDSKIPSTNEAKIFSNNEIDNIIDDAFEDIFANFYTNDLENDGNHPIIKQCDSKISYGENVAENLDIFKISVDSDDECLLQKNEYDDLIDDIEDELVNNSADDFQKKSPLNEVNMQSNDESKIPIPFFLHEENHMLKEHLKKSFKTQSNDVEYLQPPASNPTIVVHKQPKKVLRKPEHEMKIKKQNTVCDLVKKSKKMTNYQRDEQELTVIVTKITNCQQKICKFIDDIEYHLNNLTELDGLIDQRRREKCFKEFFTRLSRMYLYEIRKIMDEIKYFNHTDYYYSDGHEFTHKVYRLYTFFMRAIQSYSKHVNDMVGEENFQKLKEFVQLLLNGTDLCVSNNIFDLNDSLIRTLIYKSTNIIAIINNNNFTKNKQNKPNGNKVKTKPHKIQIPHLFLPMEKNNNEKLRFSMYKPTGKPKKKLHEKVPQKSKQILEKICKNSNLTKTNGKSKENSLDNIHKKSSAKSKNFNVDDVRTVIENIANVDSKENLVQERIEQHGTCENSKIKDLNENDLKRIISDVLQQITHKHVQEILSPLLSSVAVGRSNQQQLTTTVNNNNSNIIQHEILTALNSGCYSFSNAHRTDVDTLKNNTNNPAIINDYCKYNNNDVVNVCRINEQHNICCNSDKRNNEIQQKNDVDDDSVFVTKKLSSTNLHQAIIASPTTTTTLAANANAATTPTTAAAALYNNEKLDDGNSMGNEMKIEQGEIIIKYSDNIQHTYVDKTSAIIATADNDKEEILLFANNVRTVIDDEIKPEPTKIIQVKLKDKQVASPSDNLLELEQVKKKILQDRNRFIRNLRKNPLYFNENFDEPWKVVSRIADEIVTEALDNVTASIDFGEFNFVQDFLRNELIF